MSDLKDKSWLELCEAASREHDPEKLLELITALNDVLEQREQQEKARHSSTRPREWPQRSNVAAIYILYRVYPIEQFSRIRHAVLAPRLGVSGFWSRKIVLRSSATVRRRRRTPLP